MVLDRERSSVLSIIRDLESQLDSVSTLREALDRDLTSTRAKLRQTTEAKAALDGRARNAETALTEAQRTVRSQEKAATTLRREATERAMEIKRQRVALAGIESERGDVAAQLADTEADLANSETGQKVLQLDLGSAKETIESLRREARSLESKMAIAERERTGLRKRLGERNRENARYVGQSRKLDRDLRKTKKRSADLAAELGEARRALGDIHGALTQTKAKASRRS